MNITLNMPVLSGSVRAVASKSHAHRLLICAALSETKSQIVCSEISEDIQATVRCLNGLGACIERDGNTYSISPIKMPIIGEKILDCGESGSTLRFMLPICCALGVSGVFQMSGTLPPRPLSPLYEELISHGCALSPQGTNPLRSSGRLKGGKFNIPGNISSQYISGLMFALPLLGEDSHINIIGAMESTPYINMTMSALKDFGIVITSGLHAFRMKGRQHYTPPGIVDVEGDWSNAAFWLCAGVLSHQSITVLNLREDSLQGDKAVLEILQRFGAQITRAAGSVTVTRGQLSGIDIDAGDTPDLVPILAVVAAVSDGITRVYNAGRLRIKESDRLKAVTEVLRILGADIEETPDGLIISGKSRLTGGTIHSYGDHRMAMMAAIASTVCSGPVIIQGAEAVHKSYPGFFGDFNKLGGATEEEK